MLTASRIMLIPAYSISSQNVHVDIKNDNDFYECKIFCVKELLRKEKNLTESYFIAIE